jgi:hypothetical protein
MRDDRIGRGPHQKNELTAAYAGTLTENPPSALAPKKTALKNGAAATLDAYSDDHTTVWHASLLIAVAR